jgi:hypothetical protein
MPDVPSIPHNGLMRRLARFDPAQPGQDYSVVCVRTSKGMTVQDVIKTENVERLVKRIVKTRPKPRPFNDRPAVEHPAVERRYCSWCGKRVPSGGGDIHSNCREVKQRLQGSRT